MIVIVVRLIWGTIGMFSTRADSYDSFEAPFLIIPLGKIVLRHDIVLIVLDGECIFVIG